MSRISGAFWFLLVLASAMTNFIVKQNVQGLDEQLTAVRKKTAAEQKAIHELTADWTFLNQPELLADLNSRYVHLIQQSPKQVVTSLDGIPLRPAPPPPPEPVPQVAAAPASAPQVPGPQVAGPQVPGPQVAAASQVEAPKVAAPQFAEVAGAAVVPLSAPAPAPVAKAPAAPPRPRMVQMAANAPARPPASPRPLTEAVRPAPAQPSSLDGLFAQVSGGR